MSAFQSYNPAIRLPIENLFDTDLPIRERATSVNEFNLARMSCLEGTSACISLGQLGLESACVDVDTWIFNFKLLLGEAVWRIFCTRNFIKFTFEDLFVDLDIQRCVNIMK